MRRPTFGPPQTAVHTPVRGLLLLCSLYLKSDIFGGAMTPLLLLFATAVSSLPWVEDDYGKALADAKTRHVPLFVEVWAPW